jgi:uncharacterized small protein (DUF1192 family)
LTDEIARLKSQAVTITDDLGRIETNSQREIARLKADNQAIRQSVSGLEALRPEVNQLKSGQAKISGELKRLETNSQEEIARLKADNQTITQSVSRLETLRPEFIQQIGGMQKDLEWIEARVEVPLKESKPTDGILAFLGRKYGDVLQKGIVNITSKSVALHYALAPLAVVGSSSSFESEDKPGQWVCWDFRGLRVRPTHYTIWANSLESWILEGSMDNTTWTEMHLQTGSKDFDEWRPVSFTIAKPVKCRFIRLTQTGKNGAEKKKDALFLASVEFFGTV